MSNQIHKFVLPNGLRVLCERVEHVQSAAVGIWCQNGSRLEADNEAGISHLIEHMLFKGTPTRTAEQIAQEIEGRGGHLNAFTDRELTCYYARVLADDLTHAVEVLSDMFVNSLMNPDDLELEKGVVQEEILKYEDSPEDHIHDLHARTRWGEHPLGRPIIGSHESVGSFTPDDLKLYMKRKYVGAKTLLVAAGKLDPDELKDAGQGWLRSLKDDFNLPTEPPPTANAGEHLVKKDVEQVHFCIGGDCVKHSDERRYTASVMDAILGGSMSSRLFQEIREKRGLVYAIGSYTATYREAGAYTIYGGTSPKNFDQVREIIDREIRRMCDEPVPEEELERTKRMLSGNVVLSLEGMGPRMHRLARNEIIHGREVPIEETLAKINAVTSADIQSLAQEFLKPDLLTTTAIGPF